MFLSQTLLSLLSLRQYWLNSPKAHKKRKCVALSLVPIPIDSIQPQVPLRLPCYDFTPVEDPTVVCANKTNFQKHSHPSLCGTSGTQKSWVIIGPMLRAKPIPRVWRAVCTGPGYIFTAACWSAITSDSNFMFSSCREQSELRQSFRIRSALQPCFPL